MSLVLTYLHLKLDQNYFGFAVCVCVCSHITILLGPNILNVRTLYESAHI